MRCSVVVACSELRRIAITKTPSQCSKSPESGARLSAMRRRNPEPDPLPVHRCSGPSAVSTKTSSYILKKPNSVTVHVGVDSLQKVVMHAIGKSTNVGEETRFTQRLPAYWFDSRRRYFGLTRRIGVALLIDVAAIASSMLGLLKSKRLGRPTTPQYIRDLLAYSIVLRKNRDVASLKSFFPPL
jgi:hypothetical protein